MAAGEDLDVCRMAVAAIYTSNWMKHKAGSVWEWGFQILRPGPFSAVILSLLPNLTELSILRGHDMYTSIFTDMFGVKLARFRSSKEERDLYRPMIECTGLANLQRFRTDSISPMDMSLFKDIESLTSLHIIPHNTTYPPRTFVH
jgi:hypothetical protein